MLQERVGSGTKSFSSNKGTSPPTYISFPPSEFDSGEAPTRSKCAQDPTDFDDDLRGRVGGGVEGICPILGA